MKLFRFGALFICLALSLAFVHTAAAVHETETPPEEEIVSETPAEEEIEYGSLPEQYAAELSGYTSLACYKGENAARYVDFKIRFPDYSWETVITQVNIGLDTPYYTDAAEIGDPGRVDVLVNKYHYLPNDYVPDGLEKINSAYCFKTELLAHDARVAFERMCADARSLGYTLYATSSYRSYARQSELYASYGIPDVTTARPGYSEHQTGLAVDVIHHAGSNSTLDQSDVFKWYYENACKYGFILRYGKGWEFQTGCAYEPWHLRYLGAELATAVKNSNLSYDEYYARYIDVRDQSEDDGSADAVGISAAADITAGGASYSLSAFRVLGDTYFKLRDIAIVLSGTDLAFDVSWNAEEKCITLLPGTDYSSEPATSELEPGLIRHMTATSPPLEVGDASYEPGAFMVGGSNYYTLDSLGELFGFSVTADEAGALLIVPAVDAGTPETVAPAA